MLLHVHAQDECINPLSVGEECPTATPTETVIPEPTAIPTAEPTPELTETPVPRDTPTPRPTPDLPERLTRTPRPTRMPGPERARSEECLAAPPAVPDVPGIRERMWTPAERCGGTPEAQATQYVVDRVPEVPPAVVEPLQPSEFPQVVVVIINVFAPSEPTARPTLEPEQERSSIDRPQVPVQVPEPGLNRPSEEEGPSIGVP